MTMRREAQLTHEFNRLAANWPETARFLVDAFRCYPDGGISIYVPCVRRPPVVPAAGVKARRRTVRASRKGSR